MCRLWLSDISSCRLCCDTQTPRSGLTCYSDCAKCEDYGYLASRPTNHECKTQTPRTGLTCYSDCEERPCEFGSELVNGVCEKVYESCAEAGYIEEGEVWVGDCGKYIDGCAPGGKKMKQVFSGHEFHTCYLPECAVPNDNLCKKVTPLHNCDYYGYLDASINDNNHTCWSLEPEDGLVCYQCIRWCSVNENDPSDTRCWNMNNDPLMNKLPVFAENIQENAKVLTLANIDENECYNRYIKALEENLDDDDFVTYI